MQWHTCVQVGLYWLQRGTGQHHPGTVEMQPYSCCILCLVKYQMCDGACHSFPDGPAKRKGNIWWINNIRWKIRRDFPKVFMNVWVLQILAGRSEMLKACKEEEHQVLLSGMCLPWVWLKVTALIVIQRRNWKCTWAASSLTCRGSHISLWCAECSLGWRAGRSGAHPVFHCHCPGLLM